MTNLKDLNSASPKLSSELPRGIFLLLPPLLLVLLIGGVVVSVYFSEISKDVPIYYSGDAIVILAHVQAFTEGEFIPFLPKRISRLNAPSEAWWSDFPTTDFVYVIPGLLASFGLSIVAATTWTVVGLHVAAGLSFYFASRWLEIGRWEACAFGVLFGLAPYGFARGLEHLMLLYYWVVPLFLAVVVRIWGGNSLTKNEGMIMAAVMLITGLFNPYYFALAMILLGFVGTGRAWVKDWNGLRWTIVLGGVGVFGFVLQNSDTFLLIWKEGPNPFAVSRDLWWMVKFGLYLPDIFLPQAHLSRVMEHVGGLGYHWKIPEIMRGESQRAYIGVVAGLALIWLIVCGFLSGSSKEKCCTSNLNTSSPAWQGFFWLALVVFIFSVAGGVNYLIGALGFPILRGSNRYAIVLACLSLFFAAKILTPWPTRSRWKNSTLVIILLVGIFDQWPKWPDWVDRARIQGGTDFREDEAIFPELEAKLPTGALIFQLPVMPYPENGAINTMGDYEHFRPYIHTKTLGWSYGTVKGRPHADWQYTLDFHKNPAEAVSELRNRGFGAVMVNRRAYDDEGRGLAQALESAGCAELLKSSSYFFFSL